MKDRQNSQIKKRQYENNKEINGKEIFCELLFFCSFLVKSNPLCF